MWRWIAVPKSIALVAFLLPWMTVSCSGRKMASASGFDLTMGSLTVTNPMTGAVERHSDSPNFLLILALVAIAFGLWTLFQKDRAGARLVMATSLGALALIWIAKSGITVERMAREAERQDNSFDSSAAEFASTLIRIDWQFGFWLATLALLASAAMAWLVFANREAAVLSTFRPGDPAPPQPEAPENSAAGARVCPVCGKRYGNDIRFCPDDGSVLDSA